MHQFEQGAQDASTQRGALADEAREGNASASYQVRTGRPSPVSSDRIDQVLSQPSPTAGASPTPIPLPAPADTPAAQGDVLPTIQDKTVVPADADRGVKPVNLPVEVPSALTHPSGKVTAIDEETGLPIVKRGGEAVEKDAAPKPVSPSSEAIAATPDTHVFSLTQWRAGDPTGDVDAAARAAADAGYEVQA